MSDHPNEQYRYPSPGTGYPPRQEDEGLSDAEPLGEQAGETSVEQGEPTEGSGAVEPVFGERADGESIFGEKAAPEPLLPQQPPTSVAIFAEAPPGVVMEEPVISAPPAVQPPGEEPKRQPIASVLRSGDRRAIAELVERTARILFATAIFLVPVVFDPRTIDSFNLVKLTTVWFLGVASLGAWWYATYLADEPRNLPRARLIRLALILLGITAAATLLSPNRTLSFIGLYHRYEGLISIAIYVGVVLLLGLLFSRRPDALREVATAAAAAGGFVAGYVVLQRFGIDVSQWRQATGQPPTFPIGTLGNSAFSASYIGIAAPFVVYCGLSARNAARKLAWLAVIGAMVLALWFTSGRAGILGALVGIVALFLFSSQLRTLWKLAFVPAALVFLASLAFFFGDPADPAQRGLARTATAGYRVQIWDASWRMFLNRPVLGWGPESYYGNYTRFRTADEARAQGLAITDKPHNVFLGWATATGIVGFGAWFAMVGGALFLVASRAAKQIRARRMLAAAFGAGLAAYLAQGVYSIDVPPLALMSWVAVGAIAVLLERRSTTGAGTDAEGEGDVLRSGVEPDPASAMNDRSSRRGRRLPDWSRRGWVVPSAVGVLLAFLVFIGFGPLRADHAAWSAERRTALGWSSDTLELYEKAIALNPREAAYRGLAGAYYERTAGNLAAPLSPETSLRRAASFYMQALDIQPRNVYFMINLARVYSRLGKEVDAKWFALGDRYLGRAVTLDPLNPQMHDLYADLLNQWQEELGGRQRRQMISRAQTQAAIAQALRAGRIIR